MSKATTLELSTDDSPDISRPPHRLWLGLLLLAMLVAVMAGCGFGAVTISPWDWAQILLAPLGITELSTSELEMKAGVLWSLRLPRVVCGLLVGAGLALAGAAMQGLFRNPLADPALIGVSSGAALGAAIGIIAFGYLRTLLSAFALSGTVLIAGMAFLGGFLAAIMVQRMGQHGGRTAVATMLLAGIAINALCGAFTGLMLFMADDNQLRDITFWMLGSLGASTWPLAGGMAVVTFFMLGWLMQQAGAFNALLLGEAEASHLGYEVESFKRRAVFLSALLVGLAVSFTGVIGFVGLVVPHLVRLAAGADHRFLFPASAILGGTLLVLADMICRNLGPAELPIGIITALLGAPFFLYLMRRQRWVAS